MNATNTVLVTGAMGQLGKRVARILLDRGYAVVALDLRNPATEAVLGELARSTSRPRALIPAYVNLLDAEALRALVLEHRPSSIVHIAAMVAPAAYRNPAASRRVNVEGTRNLVDAAKALPTPPLFIEASSASVYGPRNPHRYHDRLTALTPTRPIDCYGEDKVLAEKVVADSGLPHASLRIGGIISPDAIVLDSTDHQVLLRAIPSDNRIHTVDVRDAALAFANAVDFGVALDGKILLIGGDESHVLTQSEVLDGVMDAIGVGRLGAGATLPGDPDDDRGWGLTDWFDTTESQTLLQFQEHPWSDTMRWLVEDRGWRRTVIAPFGPVLRVGARAFFAAQRAFEKRGRYAAPWALLSRVYGPGVLASAEATGAVSAAR